MSQINVDELIVTQTARIKDFTESNKPAGKEGLMIYNSELGSMEIYINGEWKIIGKGRNDGSTPEKAAVNGATLAAEYPTAPSGAYYIKPPGQSTAYKLWVDIQGTYTNIGAMKINSAYGSYSARYSSCGGPADGDCAPNGSSPTPYFQGGAGALVDFVWQDQDGTNIPDAWLVSLQGNSTVIDASTTSHWSYDAENVANYRMSFKFVDGTSNTPEGNWQPGQASGVWLQHDIEGRRMMTGGTKTSGGNNKIPKTLDIITSSTTNWGWHIRFNSTDGGGYGIWVV